MTLSRDADEGAVTLELDGVPLVEVDPADLLVQLVGVLELEDIADGAKLVATAARADAVSDGVQP